MPTEMLTTREPTVSGPVVPPKAEDELRRRARKNVERLQRVKENVAALIVGMIVLIPIWLVVEWQSAGGFERWSDGDRPGDWDPWILWIAVPWFLWVAFVALRAYFEQTKKAEIEREVTRLRSRG